MSRKSRSADTKSDTVIAAAGNIVIAAAMCAVIFLTALIFTMFNIINREAEDETTYSDYILSSDSAVDDYDSADYLLPEFIGAVSDDEMYGVSAYSELVKELYNIVTPVLSYSLTRPGYSAEENAWDEALEGGNCIYIRYHSSLPYQIISCCAGSSPEYFRQAINIRQLLLIPSDGVSVLGMTETGEVYSFVKAPVAITQPKVIIDSYRRNLTMFEFAGNEPVFTERVTTKNMLVTDRTAALMQNLDSDIVYLLRLFGYNPDKLSSHEESEIGIVYVETHGVLRILDDSIAFTATSGGGMDIYDIISVSDSRSANNRSDIRLSEYIDAASVLIKKIYNLNRYYIGGDAELVFEKAMTGDDSEIILEYIYCYENIRIADTDCAVRCVFSDGKLTEFRVSTIAVSGLISESSTYSESWYYNAAKAKCPDNMTILDTRLVYRADYMAESIPAQWSVLYGVTSSEETKEE